MERNSPFIWYELMASDAARAEAFYKRVVGWTARDSGVPGVRYTLFEAPGMAVAGMMDLSSCEAGGEAHPGWLGYIGVADADDAAARVTEAGGKVLRPAFDIPNVGRIAIVADPGGAAFGLLAPSMDAPPPADFGSRKLGHPGWHELYAKDGEAAVAFYEKVFGWRNSRDFDMGAMGKYRIFSTSGDRDAGGIMTAPPNAPVGWGFYFMVEAIDAAAERVTSSGGSVVNGPMEVPGGEWIVLCRDPDGAAFNLVAEKR